MANWDKTIIECSNSEIIKSILVNKEVDLSLIPTNGERKKSFCDTIHLSDDFTVCVIRTTWGVPCDNIVELSKNFPRDIITCTYSFDSNRYFEEFTYEYKNGIEEFVDVHLNFSYDTFPDIVSKDDELNIIKKIQKFFNKACCEEYNFDFDSICYTFVYKNYKIQATFGEQSYCDIDIKVFKKIETIEVSWELIKEKVKVDNSVLSNVAPIEFEPLDADDDLPF